MDIDGDTVTIAGKGSTSAGTVREIHNERRDTFSITWPCFRVDARFDGGMSGGPVFNETGELATIMEPRLRRVSLLLARIPTSAPMNLPHAKFHSLSGTIMSLHILSIDPDRSSLRLGSRQDSREVTIPLDAVRMIWRESEVEIFRISLTGTIVETSARDLQFHP